ncbi:glycosyltransferase family 4 protein [Nocardioides montaniterrae]
MARTPKDLLRGARRRLSGDAPPASAVSGTPVEVLAEQTNFGPMVDALVERARRNQRDAGLDADYDLVRESFDHYHYLYQAKELQEEPDADPIRHFLRQGAKARYSPTADFHPQKYLRRHPQHAKGPERSPYLEWLRRGRAAGEIADPSDGVTALAPLLGSEPGEVVETISELRSDLQERLRHGRLGEVFARAAEVEPLIAVAWERAVSGTQQLPFRNEGVARAAAAIHACHEDLGFRRARLVIVTRKPRWGGGRRLEGHLAHALARKIDPRDIVVIYTDDTGETPADRFPDGVREVDFLTRFRGINEDTQLHALVALIRSLYADAVLNLNSRLLYQAMKPYGRALAASENLHLVFFCDEQQALGHWEGRGLRWFYPACDYVAGIITDSEHQRRELIDRYGVSDEEAARIQVFHAPADASIPLVSAGSAGSTTERRPVVFWAGRFDRQKRPDIVVEVARRMPDVDFRLWGEKVLKGDPLGELPENVELAGPYDRFADLDLGEADAWLYTAAWDGVPSMVLEVAMTGVPLVASLVGGVGEVVSAADAWPVEGEDPAAYVAALRAILADPDAARAKAVALRERVLAERTEQAYADAAAALLLRPEARA